MVDLARMAFPPVNAGKPFRVHPETNLAGIIRIIMIFFADLESDDLL